MSSDSSSDDDEAVLPSDSIRPYAALLESFARGRASFYTTSSHSAEEGSPKKKRKKNGTSAVRRSQDDFQAVEQDAEYRSNVLAGNETEATEEAEESEGVADDERNDKIDVDHEQDFSDPFERHFANPGEHELAKMVKAAEEGKWETKLVDIDTSQRCTIWVPDSYSEEERNLRIVSSKQLKMKARIADAASKVIAGLVPTQQHIAPYFFDYKDLLFPARTVANAAPLRDICCLHALNHLFKTRDRVIKNNARLARNEDGDEELELRDQGFTRPKVLFLLETRQSCVRVVDTIIKLCQPEQQENKRRFQESFEGPLDKFSKDRPEDFRELFEGTKDNDFRLGMKFTRKTVRYFAPFYTSDIIFASPLGLRRILEHSDPKKRDSDFLSSIEIVIVDHADAMLMQNWDHVIYIFEHLNLQPRESHGCDFSRVRTYYLDDKAKYLRQTIVLSAYNTPELNSLFNTSMLNIFGRVKYKADHVGSLAELGTATLSLPSGIKQTFSRFSCPDPSSDPDLRFKHFTRAILPSLIRTASLSSASSNPAGILLFIPSYLHFVTLRNYFSTSTQTSSLSFGSISEYTTLPDARRARSHFLSGRHSILLYTGRAHHFRRYHLKGVKKAVFYAPPENPRFYEEVVGFVGDTLSSGKADTSEVGVRVLFSRWDVLALERIVGSKRVGGMISEERKGDTFDFI